MDTLNPAPSMVASPPTSEDLEAAFVEILGMDRESAQPLIDRMNQSFGMRSMLSIFTDLHPAAASMYHNMMIRAVAIGIKAERRRRHGDS